MLKGITGVHHVGMGVKDYEVMKEFYSKTLGMTETFMEFPEVWNPMVDVFRTSYHKFGGIMLHQPAGGITVELISMSIPHPRYIRTVKRYGDIGVNKITAAVSDVARFYKEYKDRINFFSKPKSIKLPEWGEYNFVYGRDPEGNLFEFVSGPKLKTKETFGGISWLGVGVTDLERSMEFYRSTVFDKVVVKPHEGFSGFVDEVADAKGTQVRSCLLANSVRGGMLELYECIKPRGRSIPFNAIWGDFGYFEVCVETDDFHAMAEQTRKEGMNHLHSPCVAFDLNDRQFWFEYVQDPDGIVVEIIGTVMK
ncbi:MAG: Glyoxalase-like domain protein [Syntrophorhabdus sp. PtaU1.Bin058]|nr:MAG: Glyoxalase-like domain protein [Syntrophorhabdus sp. PtaU1.Bin058]